MTNQTRFGDFGGSGLPSPAGDVFVTKKEAAEKAANGAWEYQVHTDQVIAWTVPGTAKTLQLKREEYGWQLYRAKQSIGSRESALREGIDQAAAYMAENPEVADE